MTNLRNLIWLYFLLLLFEGALRKWVVPRFDAPLLIIRDPLVLWIYIQAVRQHLSFNNSFFVPNLALAVITALLATFFGWGNVFVTIYGLRTDYLQIPLIFLIPQILNRDDVILMGKFTLWVALPIAALVVFQFRSPPDSFWNKGTMATHYGTVRPSGPFSFGTGLVAFFAMASAFLMYGYLQGRTYKIWLMAAVTFAILIASACSGSRSCLASVALVVVAAILCVIMRGKGGMGIIVAAVLIAILLPFLSSLSVFKEGTEQLQQRMADTAAQGEDTEGFFTRYAGTMLGPLSNLGLVPTMGYGLGLGTNAALTLSSTAAELDWPEAEWGRLIFECGPIFGVLLCIFRTALTIAIARQAFIAFRRGNILPLLLFAACGLLVLNGQWGVPATLGFAIFGAGITLAACVEPEEEEEYADDDGAEDAEQDPNHSPAIDQVG